MPTALTLSNATSVARTGSTDGWPGLPTIPASSGPYSPGDKSEYVRIKIAVPSPLASLPAMLTVYITSDVDPNDYSGNVIIDDTVSLGNSSGPLGTNAASNLAVPIPSTIRSYDVPTDGITLVNLNAGNVYLWLGWKSWLTSSYTLGTWSIAITPSSPVNAHGSKTQTLATHFVVTPTYTPSPPAYGIFNVTGTAQAGGASDFLNPTAYTGSVSVDNGLGTTASGTVATPPGSPLSRSAGPTTVATRIIYGQSATVDMASSTNIIGDAFQYGDINHTLTVAAVAPAASTLNLTAVTAYAPDSGSSVLFGYPYRNSLRLPPLG